MRALSTLSLIGVMACAPKVSSINTGLDEEISDSQMEKEIAAEARAQAALDREARASLLVELNRETTTVASQVQDNCGVLLNFTPGEQYGRPTSVAEYVATSPEQVACVYDAATEEHCNVETLPITSRPTITPSAIGKITCTGWDGSRMNPDGTKTIQVGF